MNKIFSRSLLPALLAMLLPMLAMAQDSVDVSVNVAPPELPAYDQPPIPGDGYIWTPGYWAWGDDIQDYYWVPGTWVTAPEPDYLWTPGYWGAAGAVFLWHAGYWGPQVGFYGGVNYGYGYGGNGYEGGYWRGGHLFYNRSVNNIGNVHVTNVYNKTVTNNVTVNRVSYNGGNGVHAEPNAAQVAAARDHHIGVTPMQRQHEEAARSNTSLRASENKGHPSVAATSRAGAFTGAGVVGARRGGTGAGAEGTNHSGTFSVVHPNNGAPQRDNSSQAGRPSPPQRDNSAQRNQMQQQNNEAAQREAAQRDATQQRNDAQQRTQPQVEQARPPAPQGRPAPAQPHPTAPRPVEHAPEHQEDHEHH